MPPKKSPSSSEVGKMCGWQPLPKAVRDVRARLPVARFAQTPGHIRAAAADNDVFLWKACQRVYQDHLPAHVQADGTGDSIGDCVSHAFASAVEYLQCVEIVRQIENNGEADEVFNFISSEAVYALSRFEVGRGQLGGNEGSVGAWAAEAVTLYGILPRKRIEAQGRSYDLRKYSIRRAREWGFDGLPDELEPAARQFRIRSFTEVPTYEEAASAIRNGYPVAIGSNIGFVKRRDSQGFCEPDGQWAHCMLFIGVCSGNRPGLCCLNSWGEGFTTGLNPDGMPPVAFWVDADVVRTMIGYEDCFAVSGFEGFPSQFDLISQL